MTFLGRLPPFRFHLSRQDVRDLRYWAASSLVGTAVTLLFAYVVVAFFLGDAGWIMP